MRMLDVDAAGGCGQRSKAQFLPTTTQGLAIAACAASLPLDVTHGVATVAFLAAIWLPWGRAIRRVVAKYDL